MSAVRNYVKESSSWQLLLVVSMVVSLLSFPLRWTSSGSCSLNTSHIVPYSIHSYIKDGLYITEIVVYDLLFIKGFKVVS